MTHLTCRGGAALASARYRPSVEAARRARRFVEEQLRAAGMDRLVEDVGLLLSEVTANAVLHARTDFEVRLHALAAGVRVEVHDEVATAPVLSAPGATATSGRGLVMVQALAARWGSDPGAGGGKSVWFEVDTSTPGGGTTTATADELLELWSDADAPVEDAAPVEPGLAEVVVTDLPAQRLWAAEEHVEDLLREVQLVLLDPARRPDHPGVSVCLRTAERLDAAARAIAGGRLQVREQVGHAVRRGQERVTLRLQLPASGADDVARYRDAIEDVERLGRAGRFLAAHDALARHRPVHRGYLDQVVEQLRRRR